MPSLCRTHPHRLAPGQGRDFDWLGGATGVELEVEVDGGRARVRVAGEVDLASVDVIEEVVADALDRAPGGVELDLLGVGFIDAAGREMVARAGARAVGRLRVTWVGAGRIGGSRGRPGGERRPTCGRAGGRERPRDVAPPPGRSRAGRAGLPAGGDRPAS